ncbi:MAG: hypothetical protein WD468_09890 [Pirellulales bacterium]
MAETLLECSFLIPLRRDANLSDGGEHDPETWDWLTTELFNRFRGGTAAPGSYQGFYEDPDTHQRVADESYRYIVAVEESRISELKQLLSAVCVFFQQKCVYLSVAGHVEFVQQP